MPRLPDRGSKLPDLRPYQRVGRDWLNEGGPEGRRLLADEPGLGKTAQLLQAANPDRPVLVIAPAGVLDGGVWDDEIRLWGGHLRDVVQVPYTGLNVRVKTGKTTSSTRPTRDIHPHLLEDWGTVILDEAHYIKGRDTHWTDAVRRICERAERVYLATGTPIVNWADELFVPLQLMRPSQSAPGGRLGSYWRWAGQWFDTSPTRWSKGLPQVGEMLGCTDKCDERPPQDPCEHYLEFARANLDGLMLQRLRDDVLSDLPPLTHQVVATPMTPEQRKLYRQLKRDYVAWTAEGHELSAWNDGVLHVQLRQLCVGMSAAGLPGGGGKLAMLEHDLSSRARPTVVFAHYRSTLEACAKVADRLRLRWGMVHGGESRPTRGRAIRGFKDGRLDVLFGTFDTLAEGHTLTVSDLCILVEKSYTPSRNQQAIRRIHRMGQTRPVTVREYRTPDSVDERVAAQVDHKTDRQMRHLTAAQFAAAA